MSASRIATLILSIVCIAMIMGCGDDDDAGEQAAGEATTPGAQELDGEEVPIGFLAGFTGDYGPWGEPNLTASTIAAKHINDAGGVLGGPVTIVSEDTKSTPEGAVSGWDRLTNVENIVALSGIDSDSGTAVLERTTEEEIPAMCNLCGTPILDTPTEGGDFMFRFTASDTDIGPASVQIARDRGWENVAVLASEGEIGAPARLFAEIFEENVGSAKVVDMEVGKPAYQAEVQEAFSDDPDGAYIGVGHEEAASILPEWQRRGYGGELLVGPDVQTEANAFDFLEDGVATGVYGGLSTESAGYKRFAAEYEEETGDPPSVTFAEPIYYDAIITLALAMAAAETTDGAPVAGAVPEVVNPPGTECELYEDCVKLLSDGKDINYEGASSSLDIDPETGNLVSPVLAVQEVIDGAWQPSGETFELDPALKP